MPHWLERAPDDRVTVGSNPSGDASKLWQVHLLYILPVSVGGDTISRWSLLHMYLVSMPGEVKYPTHGVNV